MRICITLAVLGLLVCSIASGDTLSEGLVARWDFNGSLRDASGNEFHGRWIGTGGAPPEEMFVEGVPGSGGQALRFDNDPGSAVEHEPIEFGIDRSHTFTMWKKMEDGTPESWNGIIGSRWGSGGFWLYHGGLLMNYQDYSREDGEHMLRFSLRMGRQIPMGEWFHLAVATEPEDVEAGTAKYTIYVNGELIQERVLQWSPRPTKAFTYQVVGGGLSGNRRFSGLMDEVRIYSRVLSDVEIKSLYNMWN